MLVDVPYETTEKRKVRKKRRKETVERDSEKDVWRPIVYKEEMHKRDVEEAKRRRQADRDLGQWLHTGTMAAQVPTRQLRLLQRMVASEHSRAT